jgi:hypothetical protein
MTLAAVLRSALIADAGVAALVAGRVYPVQLPQGVTLPAVRYQRVSNSEQLGSSVLRETRYQFDAWAVSHVGATSLAEAVKALWEDWRGDAAVKWARVANELDDYDPETDSYRVIVDVLFVTTGD